MKSLRLWSANVAQASLSSRSTIWATSFLGSVGPLPGDESGSTGAVVWTGRQHPIGYLMRKASFFSFLAFISSRIHTGVAPRPAQVRLGSFLLRYLGATFRPFMADFRRPLPFMLMPTPSPPPRRDSWLFRSSAFRPRTTPMSSRSFKRASTDSRERFLGLAMVASRDSVASP